MSKKIRYPKMNLTEYTDETGRLHRSDGPAVVYDNGKTKWYIHGIRKSFEQYCIEMKLSQEDIFLLRLKYNVHNEHIYWDRRSV